MAAALGLAVTVWVTLGGNRKAERPNHGPISWKDWTSDTGLVAQDIREYSLSMANLNIREILKLSVSERIQLVEEIWDSIAAHPESLPVTDVQKSELERRLADYHANPDQGRTWEQVRDSLDES